MIVLFCGARDWTDEAPIREQMKLLDPKMDIVVQGGARGADAIAKRVAKELHIHCAQVDAYWDLFKGGAGRERNEAMLLLKPQMVFAYPLAGPGTHMMINLARVQGYKVIVHGEEPPKPHCTCYIRGTNPGCPVCV